MSWWDTKNLAKYATQALKTAQKGIDKVLDIKDEEAESTKNLATSETSSNKTEPEAESPALPQNDSFFDSWLGDDGWTSNVLSPKVAHSDQASSGSSSKPGHDQTKHQLENSRQKTMEFQSKVKTEASLFSRTDSGSTLTKDMEDLPKKAEGGVNLGLTASVTSAFDQVQQSQSITEIVKSSESNLEARQEEAETKLTGICSDRKNDLSETGQMSLEESESVTVSRSYLGDEACASSLNPETHHPLEKPKLVLDKSRILKSRRSDANSKKNIQAPYSSKDESSVESVAVEPDMPLLQLDEQAGWTDVSLNLLDQERTTVDQSSDNLSVKHDKLSTDAEIMIKLDTTVSVSADKHSFEANAGGDNMPSLPCDELVNLLTGVGEVSVSTDDISVSERNLCEDAARQHVDEFKTDLLTDVQGISVSIASNTSDSEGIDKKDVLKSVSSSMLSSTSEIDTGLKEVVSLEGSLAASDELSESNKTLTADDLDLAKDDTDVEEGKQEFCLNEDVEKDATSTVEGNLVVDMEDMEEITFECGKEESEVSQAEHTEVAVTCDVQTRVSEVVTELTVNVESSDQIEIGKNGDSPQSIMNGSSYVRNLLEEAMAESGRDSNTDTSHGSEVIRESEYTSGHTSADEIDTTTSSDIEIISHISTPNSNFRPLMIDTKPFDVSPSKAHAWSRSMRSVSPHGHKRSDSGSSAQSLQSRNGEDLVSPDGGLLHRGAREHSPTDDRNWRHHDHRVRRNPGIDMNRQQIPETSDQDGSGNPYETEKLLKKMAEMAHIIDAREKKQLELCQENAVLLETNNILKNQLKQVEEAREAELEDLKEVNDEFSRRIAESEKKLQMVLREKEMLKKTLQDLELGKRSENVMNEKLLKEKEQIIAELMEEGEKLSKQQLQSNNIIKKLRSKEKDNETTIRTQKQRVDEQKEELERLEGILEVKVDSEKKNVDAINQLNLALKSQEDEINRLKSDLEDAVEKARSLKVALDNSYKEISELHKARYTDVSEAQKIAINTEMQAKEELKKKLEEHQLQTKHQQAALVTQIEDLQLSLCRMEKEHGRREDILRQEISDLQQRLQEAEERNQELTQSVSAATRPLLRQIENLQTTYSVQTSSYDRVEKNLTDRLSEAQSQLAIAVEKERMSADRLMETSSKVSSLELLISTLRQERVQLQTQLDMEHAKVEVMQESKNNEAMQRDSAMHKLQLEISDLKKDKVLLENQLEMEKMKVEAEKKRVSLVHEQLREKEITMIQMSASASQSGTAKPNSSLESLSMTSSTATICPSPFAQDDADKMSLTSSSNRMSIYDSLRLSSTSSLLENLQSQLKQRDGEIVQLQSDIGELERTRESMARQLVTLTLSNEDLEHKISMLASVENKYMELDSRYNALLQMYGEKVEEADELRMDLQDVKDMYKSQIDELLKAKALPSNWNYE